MNICVVATASRESGALSIYKQFMEALMCEREQDKYYVFIDSCMPAPQHESITYIKVRTKGFGRIWFDFFGFRRLLKKHCISPDRIVSFQNTGVRCSTKSQIIYFHNLLPLVKRNWNPFKYEERSLFFYRFLYPQYVRLLLQKEMKVAVQANFIKGLFSSRFGFPAERIGVFRPGARLAVPSEPAGDLLDKEHVHFLYPALPLFYKRHDILINAARCLRESRKELFHKIVIHLTADKQGCKHLMRDITQNQLERHFVFHGQMPQPTLYGYYSQCHALLFPSEMETIGLPLLEAASVGLPIAVTDRPYARETLSDYSGVSFIAPEDNGRQWAEYMADVCNNPPGKSLYIIKDTTSWSDFIRWIKEL